MTSECQKAISNEAVSPALKALQEAAEGLLFLSETDAPLESFFWPAQETPPLTPDQLAKLAGAPAKALIKTVKLETFFRPTTTEQEWHNEEEKDEVSRFKDLVKTI